MIEWKESWKDEYLKWICGFANAQGGVLYIGKDDKGQVVGVKNSKKLMEDIPNRVRDILGILVDVDLLNEDNKEVIRITVSQHSYPVSYKGEYHYRAGSTKQVLKGATLTEFLTSKTGRTWDSIPVENVMVEDLDRDSFDIFRSQALKSERMTEKDLEMSNEQLLDSLALTEDGKLMRAAVLLFHKNPEKWIRGSYIKIGFFENNVDLRYQDEIHGSLMQQAERVMDLLYTKYLKAYISYKDVTRVERYPFPKEAIREAIYNAIVHQNYATQVPMQISVYDDKIYIANDCIFPIGWTWETLLEKHQSRPYNPHIANGFFRAGFVETWGRGIEKICEACQKHGIDNPKYTGHPEDIMVLFQANKKRIDQTSVTKNEPSVTEVLTKVDKLRMEEILNYLGKHGEIDNAIGREVTGKSAATVKRYLNKLCEVELVEGTGSTNKRVYKVNADVWNNLM